MTMREKIARALFDATWSTAGYPHASFESYDGDGPEHNPYRRHADAVLEAMCEPTEAMTDAARVEADAAGTSIRQHEIEGIFRAMIEAA